MRQNIIIVNYATVKLDRLHVLTGFVIADIKSLSSCEELSGKANKNSSSRSNNFSSCSPSNTNTSSFNGLFLKEINL